MIVYCGSSALDESSCIALNKFHFGSVCVVVVVVTLGEIDYEFKRGINMPI